MTRSFDMSFRKVFAILAGITVVKIAIFLALVSVGRARPFVGDNAVDHYLPAALRLDIEGRFNGPDSRQDSKVPIGYPAVLALAEKLLPGHFLTAIVCLQMGFDLLGAMLLYWLGHHLRLSGAGLLAGIGWLIFPPELVMSTWITAEPMFTVLFLACICVLVGSLDKRDVTGALVAGLILGIATLFRGTCVFLPFALIPLWLSRHVPLGIGKGLAFTAGLFAVVLPWTIRNQIVLKDPILVSVGFGSAFRQGAEARFMTIDGKRKYYPVAAQEAEAAGMRKPQVEKESAIDHWLLQLGIYSYKVRARKRPLSFVPFAIYKFFRLWYGVESGRRTTELFLGLCSLVVAPLGLWQVLRWRKSLPELSLLFGLTLAYFILLHWVSLPEYRYMHPVFPILIFAVACWVTTRLQGSGVRAPTTPALRSESVQT